MNKKMKSFFKNYQEDMTPNLNLEELRNYASLKSPNQEEESKQFSFYRFIKSFMIILFFGIFGGLFIYVNNYRGQSDGDANKIFSYLEENFTDYDPNPLLVEKQIKSDLQIFFFHAMQDTDSFIVVYVQSNTLYNVKVMESDNIVLELDTKQDKMNHFLSINNELELIILVEDGKEVNQKLVIINR